MMKRPARVFGSLIERRKPGGVRVTSHSAQTSAMQEPLTIRYRFAIGSRIEVKPSAGPRLCGKTGTLIGAGYYPKSLRVILDGSKSAITLHVGYVAILDEQFRAADLPSPIRGQATSRHSTWLSKKMRH